MPADRAEWSVQVNDLVGGWIVTNYPAPLLQHDRRPDGVWPAGYIFAECITEEDATLIARFLNDECVERPVLRG